MQDNNAAHIADYRAIALLGILLWQTTVRSASNIFRCLFEELWSRNLVNMFSLPISLGEWIASLILYDAIILVFVIVYCTSLIVFFYNVSIWYIISAVCLFGPPLFFSGIWLGLTCLQLTIYFGKRAEELSWSIPWFFAPFSAAFYPKSVLPAWAQTFSSFLPMSYAFEGMRASLIEHADPTPYIIKAYILSIIYVGGSVLLLYWVFNRTKQKGLSRLFN
jgi:ABC-2 type transport system permease protein